MSDGAVSGRKASVGVFEIRQKNMGAALADAKTSCGSTKWPCCPPKAPPCCTKKSRCCLPSAWDLRRKYVDSLTQFENISRVHETRYRAALFVKEVAERLTSISVEGDAPTEDIRKRIAETKKLKKEVWPSLRRPGGKESTSNYESSFLLKDIEEMGKEIRHYRDQVNDAAKALCDWIRNRDHLAHLEEYHWDEILDEATARDLYQVDYKIESALGKYEPGSDQPYLRVSDHCLAVLTEKLHLSEPGNKLLDELFDENGLGGDETPAFRKMWWAVKKTKKIPKTVGLHFFNLSQRVLTEFAKAFPRTSWESVQEIVSHDRIGPALEFLGKRIYPDAPKLMKREVEELAQQFGESIGYVLTKDRNLRYHLNDFLIAEEAKVGKLKAEGKAGHYSSAVVTISLFFSTYALAKKIRSDDVDLKTVLPVLRDVIDLTKEQMAIIAGKKVDSLGGRGLTAAESIKNAGKYLGAVSGAIGMVLNVLAARKALDEGQQELFYCNMISAGLSCAGAIGTLLCPPLGAVMMVASIAMAVVSAAYAQSPVINWIRCTRWGIEGTNPGAMFLDEEVIPEYYKRVVLTRGWIITPSVLNKIDWVRKQRVADGKFRRSDDGTFTVQIETRDATECELKVVFEVEQGWISEIFLLNGKTSRTITTPVKDETTTVTFDLPKAESEYEANITASLLVPDSKEEFSVTHVGPITIVP